MDKKQQHSVGKRPAAAAAAGKATPPRRSTSVLLAGMQRVDLTSLMQSVQTTTEMLLEFYQTGEKKVVCSFGDVFRALVRAGTKMSIAKMAVVASAVPPTILELVGLSRSNMDPELADVIVAPLALELIASDSTCVELLGSLNPVVMLSLAKRFKAANLALPTGNLVFTSICRAAERFAAVGN